MSARSRSKCNTSNFKNVVKTQQDSSQSFLGIADEIEYHETEQGVRRTFTLPAALNH